MSTLRTHLRVAPPVPENPGPSEKERLAIQAWLHGLSDHTRRSYAAALGQFITASGHDSLTGALCSENVAYESIRAYLATLEGKAPATIGARLSALRKLMIELWRWKVIPDAFSHMLPVTNTPVVAPAVYPSHEQCLKVIELEPDPELKLLLRLLYGLGLRIGEALDVEFKHFTRKADGQIELWLVGKGNKAATLEVCPPENDPAPAVFLRTLGAEIRALGEQRGWKGRVFVKRAERATSAAIVKAWRRGGITELRRLDGTRIEGPSAHTWRHCFCTHVQQKGATVAETKATSRHSKDDTLAGYTHRAPENPARSF